MLDLAIPLIGKPGNSAKFGFDCPVKAQRPEIPRWCEIAAADRDCDGLHLRLPAASEAGFGDLEMFEPDLIASLHSCGRANTAAPVAVIMTSPPARTRQPISRRSSSSLGPGSKPRSASCPSRCVTC